MENDKIVGLILKDTREPFIFKSMLEEDKLVEKSKWIKDVFSRQELYQKYKKKYPLDNTDADRWDENLKWYKKYSCLNFDENKHIPNYEIDQENYINCRISKDKAMRISADLLTNVSQIMDHINTLNLNKDDKNVVAQFLKVEYTIGNFCPVWKNIGGWPGTDTAWCKLSKLGTYSDGILCNSRLDGLDKRENSDNLRLRSGENVFMILPNECKAHDLVKYLYLIDYFDSTWQPLYGYENIKSYDKTKLLNFLSNMTKLIIQRSYRIVVNNTDSCFTSKDKKILCEIFERIKIRDKSCIEYSKS